MSRVDWHQNLWFHHGKTCKQSHLRKDKVPEKTKTEVYLIYITSPSLVHGIFLQVIDVVNMSGTKINTKCICFWRWQNWEEFPYITWRNLGLSTFFISLKTQKIFDGNQAQCMEKIISQMELTLRNFVQILFRQMTDEN